MLPVNEPAMYEIEEYAEIFTQEMLGSEIKPNAVKWTRQILDCLDLPMRYRQEGLSNWICERVTKTIDDWTIEEGETDA